MFHITSDYIMTVC